MAYEPTQPQLLLPGMLSEELDEFVTSLSGLKDRIEAGEDISATISWIENELPRFLSDLKKNNNEQLHCVTVDWKGPFSLDKVLQMRKDDDCGVYQIYGDHPANGKGSLLYIGETTDQTFGQRFAYHKNNKRWLQDAVGVSIHIGRIVSNHDKYDRKQLIKDTEALTINKHPPARNSKNLETYSGCLLKVVNTGEYGKLQPEYVSSPRYREG